MSNSDRAEESGNPSASSPAKTAGSPTSSDIMEVRERSIRSRYQDMQSAMRFPIKLPVSVKSNTGANAAETQNISANGVLFRVDSDMPIGSPVDFTLSLP